MQPIFLWSGMDAALIPDDMKFNIVVVKCEWSLIVSHKRFVLASILWFVNPAQYHWTMDTGDDV